MKLLFKIFILIFISINVHSETLILGVERDWTAYRSDSGDKRTCFISSEPKSSKGDYKKEKFAPNAWAVLITAPAFIALETFSTPMPK